MPDPDQAVVPFTYPYPILTLSKIWVYVDLPTSLGVGCGLCRTQSCVVGLRSRMAVKASGIASVAFWFRSGVK